MKEMQESGKGYYYGKQKYEKEWRGDLLKDLSKKRYGNSYEDKLINWVKEQGGTERDANAFRSWMNERESGDLEKSRKERVRSEVNDQWLSTRPQKYKGPEKEEEDKGFDFDFDFGKFGQSALRSTGKVFDAILPGTPTKGFLNDMEKNDWGSDNFQSFMQDAFGEAKDKKQAALDAVSSIGGLAVPGMGAYKAVDKGLDLLTGLPKALQTINKTRGAMNAGKGLASGTALDSALEAESQVYEGENQNLVESVASLLGKEAPEIVQNQSDLTNAIQNIAMGGVAGTVIDGVISGVSALRAKGVQNPTPRQIADEAGISEFEVDEVREILRGTLDGQSIVDTNAPRLGAPETPPVQGISGPTERMDDMLGLSEPLYGRPKGVADEVQIDGTPQLEAPINPKLSEDLDNVLGQQQEIFQRRQMEEDAFVAEKRKPIDELFERVSQAESKWNQAKQSKDVIKNIQQTYGPIIIPESNWADWGHELPPTFRAKRGETRGVDIYRFADDMGMDPDEAVQYLKGLVSDTKVKRKDLMPEGVDKFDEAEYEKNIEDIRQQFQGTDTAKGLDDLFENLTNLQRESEAAATRQAETETMQQGDPLQFKQQKAFKREPVSYVGKMDPKDQSAVRSESDYSTRYKDSYSGDTLEVNPAEPLEFKRTVEQEGMRSQVKRPVQRGVRAELNSSKPQSPTPKNEEVDVDPFAPVEPKGKAKPVGLTPGNKKADGPIHRTERGWRGLVSKIKDKKVNFPKTKQEFKSQYISDTQMIKDLEREIIKMDNDNVISKLPDGSASVKDSFHKSTRAIRRSVSQAVKSIDKDYKPIMETLNKNDITPDEFDDYLLAVHANDILTNNKDKLQRAGEIHNELEALQKQITNETDKKKIAELTQKEKDLRKEQNGLEPYMLPEKATEKWVKDQLAMRKNNKVIQQAQKDFIAAQNKDIDYRVRTGDMTAGEAAQWKKAHPNYVSMRRNIDDSETKVRVGEKRKLGSEDQILSPFESAILNRVATVRRVNENIAKQKIAKLAQVKGQKWFNKIDLETATDRQKENAIRFRENGQEVAYEVPPALKNVWDNLTESEAKDWTNSLLRSMNTMIKKGATHFNTDFIAKSITREPQSAIMSSRTNMHPGDLVLGFMDSFMGEGLEKLTGGKFKSYREAFKDGGGDVTGYISMDYESANKALADIQKGKLGKNWNIINPLKWIEATGSGVENSVKLAEYRSAKKKGYSNDDAMFEAVDIFDFSDAGSSVRKLNQKIPYLNAAIRGNARILQAAKENKGQFLMKGVGYITLPTIAAYAARFQPGVSEDQRKKLRNMPEYRKNMFWHIPIANSDDNTIIAIPKAHLVAQLFANPVERVLDKIYDDSGKSAEEIAKDSFMDTGKMLVPPSSIALVSQITGAVSNYDWFMDMPIEDSTMEREPDKTKRYNMYTSEVAKKVGEITGQSPAKIDYVLKGLTGGTGRDALDTMDNLLAKGGDGDRPTKINSIDEILNPIKGYKYDATGSSGMYDRIYKAQQKDKADGKKTSPAIKYYEEMREVQKEIKATREDMKLSSEQKRSKITRLRDEQRRIGDRALKSGVLNKSSK